MAYLGNDDLHPTLRKQAKLRGKSVAHPTPLELKRRRQLLQKALRMSAGRTLEAGRPAEEMLREDRAR